MKLQLSNNCIGARKYIVVIILWNVVMKCSSSKFSKVQVKLKTVEYLSKCTVVIFHHWRLTWIMIAVTSSVFTAVLPACATNDFVFLCHSYQMKPLRFFIPPCLFMIHRVLGFVSLVTTLQHLSHRCQSSLARCVRERVTERDPAGCPVTETDSWRPAGESKYVPHLLCLYVHYLYEWMPADALHTQLSLISFFQSYIDPPTNPHNLPSHIDGEKCVCACGCVWGWGVGVHSCSLQLFFYLEVDGSLMATVSMATLLEQPLPTTFQKIRDVIFKVT